MPTTLFFDIETSGVDDACDITCAVVVDQNGDATWYHSGYGKAMSAWAATQIVNQLAAADEVVTFNGAGFDFKHLWRVSQDARVPGLAAAHSDMMLQFAAETGYFCSMASLADGTFPGESNKSNTGSWATTAWYNGAAEEVLKYCEQDTQVLRRLYQHAQQNGSLTRVTKAGRSRQWVVAPDPALPTLQPVSTCLAKYRANPPDTSWMSDGGPNIAGILEWAASC